jgi:hypothetical protein
VLFSSSQGASGAVDPWVKSFAPDTSFSARLSDLRSYGEPTTVGLPGNRTAQGWIFAGYIFIDPGTAGLGAPKVSSSGSGGGGSGGGASRLVPIITGGPDGGAQTGQRRVRGGSSVVEAPGVEAGVAAVAGEVRALRQAVQGDGGAGFRLGGGLS